MNLTLFQDPLCPFCMRVKQFLAQREIEIPMRNTMADAAAYKDLIKGGGRATVPCLKIERDDQSVEWLYESIDIMAFIETNVAQLS